MQADDGHDGNGRARLAQFTHRGRRQRNEDSVRAVWLPDGSILAVLCDGMGGHAAGDHASQSAVQLFVELVESGLDPKEAIIEINARLFAEASSSSVLNGMGTTLVALHTDGEEVTLYNVGDSRAYRWTRGGRVKQETTDHSFVAEAIGRGELSTSDAASSVYKNALTRAIATEASIEVDQFGPMPCEAGDTFVLCSDGFYKSLSDEAISRSLKVIAEDTAGGVPAAALDAFRAGSDDNISLVAVTVRPGVPPAASRPKSRRLETIDDLLRKESHWKPTSPSAPRRGRQLAAVALTLVSVVAALVLIWFGLGRPMTMASARRSIQEIAEPNPPKVEAAASPSPRTGNDAEGRAEQEGAAVAHRRAPVVASQENTSRPPSLAPTSAPTAGVPTDEMPPRTPRQSPARPSRITPPAPQTEATNCGATLSSRKSSPQGSLSANKVETKCRAN